MADGWDVAPAPGADDGWNVAGAPVSTGDGWDVAQAPAPDRSLLSEAGVGLVRSGRNMLSEYGHQPANWAEQKIANATGSDWMKQQAAADAAAGNEFDEETAKNYAPSVPNATDIKTPTQAAQYFVGKGAELPPVMAGYLGPQGVARMAAAGATSGALKASNETGGNAASTAAGAVIGGGLNAVAGPFMKGAAGKSLGEQVARNATGMGAIGFVSPALENVPGAINSGNAGDVIPKSQDVINSTVGGALSGSVLGVAHRVLHGGPETPPPPPTPASGARPLPAGTPPTPDTYTDPETGRTGRFDADNVFEEVASQARPDVFGNKAYPASMRTNNPGAIATGAKFAGEIGTDGKLVVFETPEAGSEALVKNLLAYQDKHNLNTPLSIISRWAPTSDGNDPAAYAATVARELGVRPTDTIDLHDPNTLAVFGRAIARVESGRADHGFEAPINNAIENVLGKRPPGAGPRMAAPSQESAPADGQLGYEATPQDRAAQALLMEQQSGLTPSDQVEAATQKGVAEANANAGMESPTTPVASVAQAPTAEPVLKSPPLSRTNEPAPGPVAPAVPKPLDALTPTVEPLNLATAHAAMQGRWPEQLEPAELSGIAGQFGMNWADFSRALDQIGYQAGKPAAPPQPETPRAVSPAAGTGTVTAQFHTPGVDWAPVPPGAILPPGVHTRTNMQTGVTEARMLPTEASTPSTHEAPPAAGSVSKIALKNQINSLSPGDFQRFARAIPGGKIPNLAQRSLTTEQILEDVHPDVISGAISIANTGGFSPANPHPESPHAAQARPQPQSRVVEHPGTGEGIQGNRQDRDQQAGVSQGSPEAGGGDRTVNGAEGAVAAPQGLMAQNAAAKQAADATVARQRLRDTADRLHQTAQKTLDQDRNTNTQRRTHIAAGITQKAEADQQLARTMHNIADAQEAGQAGRLDGVQTKAAAEHLEEAARQARYVHDRAMGIRTDSGAPMTESVADHAAFPWPNVVSRQLQDIAASLKGTKGLGDDLKAANRIHSRLGDQGKITSNDEIGALRRVAKAAMGGKEKYYANNLMENIRKYDQARALIGGTQGLDMPGATARYRDVVRDYIAMRGQRKAADPLKKAEEAVRFLKIEGFFQTPKPLAERIVREADVQPGMSVLEPSAGAGRIADAAAAVVGKDHVATVERNHTLADLLRAKGYGVNEGDAMEVEGGGYDRVLMNPPFERGQDMEHVRHAYDQLNPGGKLVAVMGEGTFGRGDKQATAFREWLAEVGGKSEKLPEGTFKESGTGVNTRLVTIEKPAERAQEPAPVPTTISTPHIALDPLIRRAVKAAGIAPSRVDWSGTGTARVATIKDQTQTEYERVQGELGRQREISANRSAAAKNRTIENPDLLQFMAMNGGLKSTGDLRAMDAHKWSHPQLSRLIRANGLSLDAMGEKLWLADYFGPHDMVERPTESQVLEKIDRNLRGTPIRPISGAMRAHEKRAETMAPDQAEQEHASRSDIEAYDQERSLGLSGEEKAIVLDAIGRGHDLRDAVDDVIERRIYDDAPEEYLHDHDFPTESQEGHVREGSGEPPFGNPEPAREPAAIGERPGAERPLLQTEPASAEELKARAAAEKARQTLEIKSRESKLRKSNQKGVADQDGGLFSSERDQGNLFDRGPTAELTPEAQAKSADIEARLNTIAKQMFGKDVNVSIHDSLTDAQGNPVSGVYSPGKRVIQIALDGADHFGTLMHEGIHALRDAGIFKPEEWKLLSEAAERSWLGKEWEPGRAPVKDRYADLSHDAQIEEAVADAMRARSLGQDVGGKANGVLDKVARFLDRVRNMMRGLGFKTADDVLARVERGEMADRTPDFMHEGPGSPDRYARRPEPPMSPDEKAMHEFAFGAEDTRPVIQRFNDWMKRQSFKETFDWIYQKNISKSLAIGRAEEAAHGHLMPAAMSAHAACAMSDQSGAVISRMFRGGVMAVLKTDTTNGGKFVGLDSGNPLWERPGMKAIAAKGLWNKFQLYAMDKRNIRATDEERGSFAPEYDRLGAYPGDFADKIGRDHPEVVQAYKEFQAYNRGILHFALASGILSFDKTVEWSRHNDYISFFRKLETDITGGRTLGDETVGPVLGGKSLVSRHKFEKMHGSETEKIGDFFENHYRNIASVIDAGMSNIASNRAMKDLIQVGWAEPLTKATRTQVRNGQVVTLKEWGRDKQYLVTNGMALDALKAMDTSPLQGFLHWATVPAKVLRLFTTHMPGFLFRHSFREGLQSWVVSPTKMLPVVNAIVGWKHVMSRDAVYKGLVDAGGGPLDYGGIFDLSSSAAASHGKSLRAALERENTTPQGWNDIWARKLIEGWHWYEKAIEAADMGTRTEIYRNVLKETGSEANAAYAAQSHALRFSRHGSGEIVKVLAATIPFLNARWQGADLVTRAALGRGEFNAAQVWMKLFMLGGLGGLLTYASQGNPAYENQPDEVKDLNWIVPMRYGPGEGDVFNWQLPIPFEAGAIAHTAPMRIMRAIQGRDTSAETRGSFFRMLQAVFKVDIVPQALKPITDVMMNTNQLSGAPIESRSLENLPVTERYTPGRTSAVAMGLSHVPILPNRQTGEMEQMSPVKWDYLLHAYFGALGTAALDGVDGIVRSADPHAPTGLPFRASDIPLVSTVLKDPTLRTSPQVEQFYELKRQSEEYAKLKSDHLRNTDGSKIADNVKAQTLIQAKTMLEDVGRSMTDLNTQRRAISASDMPPAEKYQALQNNTKAINLQAQRIEQLKQQVW